MRDPEQFRQMLQAHRRALGRTQRELARAIGLHPDVLSHKLRGRDGATLTQADAVAIVVTLAKWGALTTRAEARTLLGLMAVPPHAVPAAMWSAPPLADLEAGEIAQADGTHPVGRAPEVPGRSEVPPALRLARLPEPATPLIGRVAECASVHAALAASRIVTLTGVGGIGKTRLALRVGQEAAAGARFADGVAFVDLAPLRDPALLSLTLARALGLDEHLAVSPETQVIEALATRHVLLVVDNLEHLLEEVPLLGRLLAAAPRLHILATSRVPLRLYGEHELRVPPLPLPASGSDGPQDLAKSEAVQLFVARAAAVSPGFAPAGAALAAVAAICAALDGLPLAIELAAARIKLFPPEALLPRLSARLALLIDGPRNLPERQRTMRAAIDWSYALLTAEGRALFASLGVFAGSFDAAAAAAVCAPRGPDDTGDDAGPAEGRSGHGLRADPAAIDPRAETMLGHLSALADQSLLELAPGPTPRFRLLISVRAYAVARLAEAGTQEAIGGRHLRYYLALAEVAEPELAGPRQGPWLDRLESEHDNLREALGWACAHERWEAGLRLAGALSRFWETRGHLGEGRGWLDEVLAGGGPGVPAARAKALHGGGSLAYSQGEYGRAAALQGEALALRRQLGDSQGISDSLSTLGNVAYSQGEYGRAAALHGEALALRRQLGDSRGIANSLNNLGNVAYSQGEYGRAAALHGEALALRRQLGDSRGIGDSLNNLGNVAHSQGEYGRAAALHGEALALRRRLGDSRGIANSLNNLGNVAHSQGEYGRAAALHGEALALRRQLGDSWGIANSLGTLGNVAYRQGEYGRAAVLYDEGLSRSRQIGAKDQLANGLGDLAVLAVALGQPLRAARLGGAGEALREAIGIPLGPDGRSDHDRAVGTMRAALGAAAFAAAWAEGRALPLEQVGALTHALALEEGQHVSGP